MGKGPTLSKDSCHNCIGKDAYVSLQLTIVGYIGKERY